MEILLLLLRSCGGSERKCGRVLRIERGDGGEICGTQMLRRSLRLDGGLLWRELVLRLRRGIEWICCG